MRKLSLWNQAIASSFLLLAAMGLSSCQKASRATASAQQPLTQNPAAPSPTSPDLLGSLMGIGSGVDASPEATPPTLASFPGDTTWTTVTPWPNGILPYLFPAGMTADETNTFLAACAEWGAATGIQCVPRTNEESYITIDLNSGACESAVGGAGSGGPQVFTMGLNSAGCWIYSTVLHELGHAIGLVHEHQRTDRDSYLDFHMDLVEAGFAGNLAAYAGNVMNIGQPYDYFSIMHYAPNQGGPTEQTIVYLPWDNFDHRDIAMGASYYGGRVSAGDAAKVLALYSQYHLQPTGTKYLTANATPITLVSQQGGLTTVRITGQFLPSGNGVAVNYHDNSYNQLEVTGTIVSQSASAIQFSIPTMDGTTVPSGFYPDVTSAAMPAWIVVYQASQRNGTESAAVAANFPTQFSSPSAGQRLDPVDAAPSTATNGASLEQNGVLVAASWGVIKGANLASATGVSSPDSTDNYPTTFDGVTISLSSSAGSVPCEVYYVSPTQVNFYVPASAPLGPNTITVQSGGATTYSATVYIREVNPGLFTAKEDGTGWALGQAYWTDASTGKAQITALSSGSGSSAQYVAIPMSQATGNVTLALYGTGIRGRSDQQNVFMLFDGELGTVQYASSQPTYLGLDQVNVQVPSDLKGRGDVQAILIVDGVVAPAVDLYFQ